MNPIPSKTRLKITLVTLLLLSFIIHGFSQIKLDFSERRGFYESSFDLVIESNAPSAIIRYTLNGDEPSPTNGMIYEDPIPVNTTTVLRAISFEEGVDTSKIYTHSYLFLDDVIRQSRLIDEWPNNTYSTGAGGQAVHDYEMDSAIVDSPLYSADLIKGLKEIPSLSIVMPRTDFWDMYDGNSEKKTSIELLYANDSDKNQQDDCGIEPHSHLRLKRSMRLSFKKEYGNGMWESDIFQNAEIGAKTAVDKFDRIVLRGGNNRAWSRSWNEDRTAFTRDEWYRQSQIAASGIGSHGTFVHLYVNGLYWGLYNPVERLDESFSASYRGGEKEDWFAISHGGVKAGNPSRYNYLMEELIFSDLTTSANYNELKEYLDISNFSDYLIISWMTGVQDWPNNNWWGGMRNESPGTFNYYGWDNEWSWDVSNNANNGAWVHPAFRSNNTNGPNSAKIFNKAKVNEDFMMAFADRVYKLCYNDGAMTDENSRMRWSALNNTIRNAVVAESARWGDSLDDGVTRTRNEHWQDEVDRLDNLMDGNVEQFKLALLEESYYPIIDPPLFNHNNIAIERQEISIPANYTIALTNPNISGDIYYTVDGSDPRLSGGEVAPTALLYNNEELLINQSISLQARIKDGNIWSALHCLNLFIQANLDSLKLTEIMYNPTDFESFTGTELEFLELKNISTSASLDISGLTITNAVNFIFPLGTIIEPQQFLLIASNTEALIQKCPDVTIFGEFEGQLSNGGERIVVLNYDEESIISVAYDDVTPWPEEADGFGYSLVSSLPNPEGDQDNASLWILSEDNTCGSPGKDEIVVSSIIDSNIPSNTRIYPSPGSTKDQLIIESNIDLQSVQFYDKLGRKIDTEIISQQDREILLKNPYEPGLYLISIKYKSGYTESRIVIII